MTKVSSPQPSAAGPAGRRSARSGRRPDSVSGPVRTCVGCRQRAAQAELLRVVVRAGRVVADARRRGHGRGAYVHFRAECVERAGRKGGLAKGLRTRVRSEDAVALREFVERTAQPK